RHEVHGQPRHLRRPQPLPPEPHAGPRLHVLQRRPCAGAAGLSRGAGLWYACRMKMLAAVLLLLALINLGYACLLVVRGRADASVLPKEVFGKPSVVGDALDLNLAVERTEAALGRRLEPDLQAFAEWLTQERSRGTLAFHR